MHLFVIFGKYCQILDLDDILLRLHVMTSPNDSLFTFTQFIIVIQFLFHQPALMLVWCFLENKETF